MEDEILRSGADWGSTTRLPCQEDQVQSHAKANETPEMTAGGAVAGVDGESETEVGPDHLGAIDNLGRHSRDLVSRST